MHIEVCEKPDTVSYEDIHELLYNAHCNHMRAGTVMATALLSGEQIAQRIQPDGKCFVAMVGGCVVGTLSVRFVSRNTWYAKARIPEYTLVAVEPQYQGKGIVSMLENTAFEYLKNNLHTVIELDTAENNTHAIEVYKHKGFKLIGYKAPKNADHYSVVMVKWINECPHSDLYLKARYCFKRFAVRMRYKKGGKKRFWI